MFAFSRDGAAKLAALDRSQAVIEFEPDGTIVTANDNFLATLGYRLEDIRGRHHAMFVAPEERESAGYRSFWASLAAGEYKVAEFRRIGRMAARSGSRPPTIPCVTAAGGPTASSNSRPT